MSIYTIIRAIVTGLVGILAFIISMLVFSLIGLPSYSLTDLADRIGISTLASLIIALISSFYFIYWSIEDSLRKNVIEYTKEIANNMKKMNDELTVSYELIREVNNRLNDVERRMSKLEERVIALERLVVELISKLKH